MFCWPADLSYAWGAPTVLADFRLQLEDFVVDEDLGFELTGAGEHCWLHIQKRNLNTSDLVRLIAMLAGVADRDVAFSGMKDKRAVTSQWFSVCIPADKEPDWSQLDSEDLKILDVQRNQKKLRRGSHRYNRFKITLRNLSELEGLESRLLQVQEEGVPNYFGAQRFGFGGSNVQQALDWFSGKLKKLPRSKRSIYLSAARSYVFNQVLSERVEQKTWNKPVLGDIYSFSTGHSQFQVSEDDETIAQRVASGDVHPTGPLWGKGDPETEAEVLQLEKEVAESNSELIAGLSVHGLEQQRRNLRLISDEFLWSYEGRNLQLEFRLPAGNFATAVLREIVEPRIIEKGRLRK